MGSPKNPPKRKRDPLIRGERWLLKDGRTVTFLRDLPRGFLVVLGENGLLQEIHEALLREKI